MVNRYFIAILALVVCSTPSWAHNTNVTHPVITLEGVRLVESNDKDQRRYQELYRKATLNSKDIQGVTDYDFFWGVWNTEGWTDKTDQRLYSTMDFAEKDEGGILDTIIDFVTPWGDSYSKLYSVNNTTVVSGVVREDHPVNKVLNHFYHAYTADKLPVGPMGVVTVNSKERALDFLVESANIYGYEAYAATDEFDPEQWQNLASLPTDKVFAKKLAFQSFGEALHHVEDMSSIAHVQNDSHFTMYKPEKDDYEGLYLPHKVFEFHNDATLDNWFKNARSTSAAPVSSVKDIWPDPQQEMEWDNPSLAHRVYNASVFQADLKTPGWWSSTLSAIGLTSPLSASDAEGSGELHEMFGDRLRWQRVSLAQWPVWHIDGVGNWNYVHGAISDDAWWPASDLGGPDKNAAGHRYFYIEQKMGDEYDESNIARAYMRKDLSKDYHEKDNPVGDVKEDVLARFSNDLIPLAVQYTAGFSQYWYDRVNSPPYLKALTVRQQSISSAAGSYPFIGYQAHWQNIKSTLKAHDDQQAIFTAKRKLKRDQLSQPLYPNQELKLLLSFSEPILAPGVASTASASTDSSTLVYDEKSGFTLGFELESAPADITEREIMLPMEKLEYAPKDPEGTKDYLVGSTWEVTITQEVMKTIQSLEGAVRLIVHARDRNNHKTEKETDKGVELDDRPDTPARVYATISDGGEFVTAWHHGASPLTPEYSASKDENGDSLKPGAFAYDQGKGDRSHILWFSSNVDVKTLLSVYPEKQVDTISITSMPRPEEQQQ